MKGQMNTIPSTWAKIINRIHPKTHSGPEHLKARTNSSAYPKRLIFLLEGVCCTKSLPGKWIPFMPRGEKSTGVEDNHSLSGFLASWWSSWSSRWCQGCDLWRFTTDSWQRPHLNGRHGGPQLIRVFVRATWQLRKHGLTGIAPLLNRWGGK